MSLIHYTNEIIKIGIKYSLPNDIVKYIYNFNKNNYPNHFKVFMYTTDKLFKMSMRFCYKNNFYYNHKLCIYCDICPDCKKYMGLPNHYYCKKCDKCHREDYDYCIDCDVCKTCLKNLNISNHYYCDCCNVCADTQLYHCNDCNRCYIEEHNKCEYCNKCEYYSKCGFCKTRGDNGHYYCINCNECINDNNPDAHFKYCNSSTIETRAEALNQIKYYNDKSTKCCLPNRIYYLLIIIRLAVRFVQDYKTQNKDYQNVIYDKINEFMNSDSVNTLNTLQFNKYLPIIEKLI